MNYWWLLIAVELLIVGMLAMAWFASSMGGTSFWENFRDIALGVGWLVLVVILPVAGASVIIGYTLYRALTA